MHEGVEYKTTFIEVSKCPELKKIIGTLLKQLMIQECRAQMYRIEHLDRGQAGHWAVGWQGIEQRVLNDL